MLPENERILTGQTNPTAGPETNMCQHTVEFMTTPGADAVIQQQRLELELRANAAQYETLLASLQQQLQAAMQDKANADAQLASASDDSARASAQAASDAAQAKIDSINAQIAQLNAAKTSANTASVDPGHPETARSLPVDDSNGDDDDDDD